MRNASTTGSETDPRPAVLHLLSTRALGGPGALLLSLAQRQNARGRLRPVIASFHDGRPEENELLAEAARRGLAVAALRAGFPFDPRERAALTAVVQQSRAALLHTHGYRPDLLGYPVARRAGLPIVATLHGWTGHTWRVRRYEWLDRRALRRFDAVIAVSEAMQKRARAAGVSASRLHLIPNACDLTAFSPDPDAGAAFRRELGVNDEVALVGTVGRLSPEKGHLDLLTAAREVLATFPRARFVLVGEGPERARLEAAVTAQGLEGKVLFTGHRTDIPHVLAGLDLFVLPSHTEGLPLALLEAGAAARPVVCTDAGGTAEVIVDGRNGRLVAPRQPAALARAILSCLLDPARRAGLGRALQHDVRTRFDADTAFTRTEEVYAAALGLQAATPPPARAR